MIDHTIRKKFASYSSQPPVMISAPGRINLIGEHTDYNNGFVLPAAIDKQMHFAMAKATDTSEISIRSIDFDEEEIIDLTKLLEIPEGWQGYIYALLLEVKSRNLKVAGFRCLFGSDIPVGAGMSSSAALCCGILGGLNNIFNWELSKLEIAKIAQASEHRLGANVGLMDQFAVMHGRADNVIQLDCLDYSHQYFPLDLKEYSLVLINTKVKHALVDSAYNERRDSCERALAGLQRGNSTIKTLRDVSLAMLDENLEGIDQQDIKRVRFVLMENERVKRTTEALAAGDLPKVGELLYRSHRGLTEEYQVSCPELDLLVDLTRDEKAILGARMMGGGFGGCTINLIKTNHVESVVGGILKKYKERTKIQAEYYMVKIGDGVTVKS